jgi:hypothetical protein
MEYQMNNLIKSAAIISGVSLLAACGGEDRTSNNNVDQNYHDITTTLQGSIFSAIDGSRITDESLDVTLVQGTDYREAEVRTGSSDFAGDYSISDIPTSTDDNITYRIVSTVDGYQQFETTVSFSVDTVSLQDKDVNVIGNIYMYPLGLFASDVKVNVTFNNEPVEGATVLLNPRTASNTLTTDTNNTLALVNGFQQALSAVTDASGEVTFASANLVLGGQYNIDVMPTTYEDSQLQVNSGTAPYLTVGSTTNIRNVTMAESVPGTANGLYITSATNTDSDEVTTTGALTLTFSRAVSLVDERNVTASLTGDTVFAVLNATDTPDSTVAAALSVDGLTLTLTPTFSTQPVSFNGVNNEATADDNLVVNYSNLFVRIAESNDTAVVYDVFGLSDETGNTPSAAVQTTIDF